MVNFLKYALVVFVNQFFSYGTFIFLSTLIPTWISFTVGYILGVTIAVVGSSKFVFESNIFSLNSLKFLTYYLILLLIGQLLIFVIKPITFSELLVTSVIISVINFFVSYFFARKIFRSQLGG